MSVLFNFLKSLIAGGNSQDYDDCEDMEIPLCSGMKTVEFKGQGSIVQSPQPDRVELILSRLINVRKWQHGLYASQVVEKDSRLLQWPQQPRIIIVNHMEMA